uniref:winged helix-turn-helix domain-containing protein n=1 Tax=Pluralibacter gergoviae TaxID=61647 RepID=UPI00147FCC77|nr:winged helix-turn-helix domain-containing protein [Pluralibacter gergoviae]
MVYCINRTVIYNPDDGSLTLTDESHQESAGEISLTPTANRLLQLLIAHQGSVLAREELLEHVWDNYGLKSSNNSLNQYISMLRRNFTDLGVEEMAIVTVPRVGFMFSPELEVTAGPVQLPRPLPQQPAAHDAGVEVAPAPAARRSPPARKNRILLLLLALLTVGKPRLRGIPLRVTGYAALRSALSDRRNRRLPGVQLLPLQPEQRPGEPAHDCGADEARGASLPGRQRYFLPPAGNARAAGNADPVYCRLLPGGRRPLCQMPQQL